MEDHWEFEPQEATQEVAEVARDYASQADYVQHVEAAAGARAQEITAAVRQAFASVIRWEELEVIDFSGLSVLDLANALEEHPIILKPLLVVSNIGARALERALDLRNIDTYGRKLPSQYAHAIAGYIKVFLPSTLPLAALIQMDRVYFIDKEVRAYKGQWEKIVTQALIRFSGLPFTKVKFRHGNQSFELDSAYLENERVLYAVDVKRIEARRDIHKRADEIANKASHLKAVYPEAQFGAVIYYPLTPEHGNIRDRLSSPFIDSVQFAGQHQQSVNQAVRLLLRKFGVTLKEESI